MTNPQDPRPVSQVANPYAKGDCAYIVVDAQSLEPDIQEVPTGTPGSYASLQEAKSVAMGMLREKIATATESLERLRFLGVAEPKLMEQSSGDSD